MTNTSTNPAASDQARAVRDGMLFGMAAYTFWGLFPIYLKTVSAVPAFEILIHRVLWSVPFGALLIALRSQWGEVKKALTTPRIVALLGVSALAISANWLIYVWSVINDRIFEASLGYYINPLMNVAAGVLILGEKLRRAQIVAIGLASIGVLVLTVGAGVFPWVALALAILFTLYGYLRKTTPVGAMPGLFVETTLLSPLAFIYLIWLIQSGTAVFTNLSLKTDILLVTAGPVTVIPLVLFALAARRLRLSTIGFLQYIGPTLQFLLGLYYGETFTWAHGVCFALIWTALAIFSFDAVRANRAARLTKNA